MFSTGSSIPLVNGGLNEGAIKGLFNGLFNRKT